MRRYDGEGRGRKRAGGERAGAREDGEEGVGVDVAFFEDEALEGRLDVAVFFEGEHACGRDVCAGEVDVPEGLVPKDDGSLPVAEVEVRRARRVGVQVDCVALDALFRSTSEKYR